MALPNKLYLRRGEVRAGLGLTEEAVTKLIRAGLLKPKYFPGQARAYFERSAVEALRPEEKVSGIGLRKSNNTKL